MNKLTPEMQAAIDRFEKATKEFALMEYTQPAGSLHLAVAKVKFNEAKADLETYMGNLTCNSK